MGLSIMWLWLSSHRGGHLGERALPGLLVSCGVFQESKILMLDYLSHFSGLFMQLFPLDKDQACFL